MTTLVRVCDATYDKAPIEKEGIQVLVSCLLKLSDIGNHLQMRVGMASVPWEELPVSDWPKAV